MSSDIYNRDFVNKIWRYIKNDMSIETFMRKFGINNNELNGLIELCKLYGKDISLETKDDTIVFKKNVVKTPSLSKQSAKDLIHTELCVVSDTHLGNIHNQLHLLNEVYEEAYKRGIDTVLHVGDLVDGNYPNRPENPRQQFLHNFDEQAGYVADMYPEINGMKTYYILGSHDETHYKNAGATINNFLDHCRKDMVYLGQDKGEYNANGVRIALDHPGGGSSASLSYKPQKRIEVLESKNKPKVLLIGHYHKSYAFLNRNVQCILVPCLCGKTQFQEKQGLSNVLGAYFLDIYSDKNGNIQYFEPEEILFDKKDIWDEAGKDRNKVKKLVIKDSEY